jgi:methyl-branched lipid omega-hydroxylase
VEGALAKLRHERPVAWHQHPDSGKGFWSITRFDDVAAATRDWDTFSSAYGIQVMLDPEDAQYLGATRSMISTDPPKHTNLRSVVNRGFTPKMIAKAEGAVRERARRIVDTIAPKGEAEFVTEVADALPVAIICDMMGVPESDRARLLDLTNRLLAGGDKEFWGHARVPPGSGRRAARVQALARPETSRTSGERPDDDARARRGRRRGDAAGGPRAVLPPADRRRQRDHAHGHQSGHVGLHAVPTREAEVAGRSRRAECVGGRGDHPMGEPGDAHAADRHARHHVRRRADADRFDIARTPNEQGAFGTGGAHFCLGAHLARREVTAMFVELFRRLPDIEATAQPEKLRSNFIRGIKRLPVAFKPA